jgi:hypothetical protein
LFLKIQKKKRDGGGEMPEIAKHYNAKGKSNNILLRSDYITSVKIILIEISL